VHRVCQRLDERASKLIEIAERAQAAVWHRDLLGKPAVDVQAQQDPIWAGVRTPAAALERRRRT